MSTLRRQETKTSRRHTLITAGVLGLGTALGSIPGYTIAHQAGSGNPLRGLTAETLCSGEVSLMPGTSLVLRRVTLQPGTVISPHSHPGPVALHVESGRFGTEFIEGHGTVAQTSQDGLWEVQREIAAGDDVTMYGGDHLFYDGAIHTMRNDGEFPAVLIISTLVETGADEFIWQNQA